MKRVLVISTASPSRTLPMSGRTTGVSTLPIGPRSTACSVGSVAAMIHTPPSSAVTAVAINTGSGRPTRCSPSAAAPDTTAAATNPASRSNATRSSSVNAYPTSAPAMRKALGARTIPSSATRPLATRATGGEACARIKPLRIPTSVSLYSATRAAASADSHCACHHASEHRRPVSTRRPAEP